MDIEIVAREKGWNEALKIILLEFFTNVAWQEGLGQERKRAAANMEELVKHKKQDRSAAYQKAMDSIVLPFCEMLMGSSHGETPFSIECLETEKAGRDDALEIVLEKFMSFAQHRLQLEWRLCEIADTMKKRVEYEGQDNCQAYRQGFADIVRPFYLILKDGPQQKPPFNT